MVIKNLRINHSNKLLGLDIINNTFSFNAESGETFLCQLISDGNIVSQKELSLEEAIAFRFDVVLEYGKKYIYKVSSNELEMSNQIEFETALKLENKFIGCDSDIHSPIFYKNFRLIDNIENIKSARLYVTGLGLYNCYLNGKRVNEYYLTPGFNDYDCYLRYQTYDLFDYLKVINKIEFHLGDGWYKGRFGIDKPIDKGDKVFGSNYKLCAMIVITYYNDKQVIYTDNKWHYTNSHCLENSIYDGEYIDYTSTISDSKNCIEIDEKYNLVIDSSSNIICHKEITPELYISKKGEKILDFKQNLVGVVSFDVEAKKGTVIRLKHGEVLQDGCFYNANLRTAKACATFVSDGNKRVYEPQFTFMGFRYVLVEGLEDVNPLDFKAKVLYSDINETLECTTSNEKINKLIENTIWGQRSNFLDVATDCPQRDERLGWTGDTQVFTNTACFQMDSYNFYKKVLDDLRYDQVTYYDGDIPMYCPSLKHESGNGGAVWADSCTIIPWNLYMNYGDKALLEKSYVMVKDYINTLIAKDEASGNTGIIRVGFTFGDWLSQDGITPQSMAGGTDNVFISSVYYYNSVNIAKKMAKELGYIDDSNKYNILSKKIYNAILDEYFAPNGKLALDTQTSYVLSLYYKIYRNKERVIEDFKNRLSKDFYTMKTGFTGTPLILLALMDNGLVDDAYRILFNEKCPGWLYQINLGATTIWERWNSLLEDGTISGIHMNSLNHYALGSVCEAIYSKIAGLTNLKPGFKEVLIKPNLNYRLKHINFKFDSISGTFQIKIDINDDKINLNLKIPYGVKAQVKLYDLDETLIGGDYQFEINCPNELIYPFNLDTPNIDIINNDDAKEIMKKYLTKAYYMLMGENKEFTINNARFFGFLPMFEATNEDLRLYEEEVKKVKA